MIFLIKNNVNVANVKYNTSKIKNQIESIIQSNNYSKSQTK